MCDVSATNCTVNNDYSIKSIKKERNNKLYGYSNILNTSWIRNFCCFFTEFGQPEVIKFGQKYQKVPIHV